MWRRESCEAPDFGAQVGPQPPDFLHRENRRQGSEHAIHKQTASHVPDSAPAARRSPLLGANEPRNASSHQVPSNNDSLLDIATHPTPSPTSPTPPSHSSVSIECLRERAPSKSVNSPPLSQAHPQKKQSIPLTVPLPLIQEPHHSRKPWHAHHGSQEGEFPLEEGDVLLLFLCLRFRRREGGVD